MTMTREEIRKQIEEDSMTPEEATEWLKDYPYQDIVEFYRKQGEPDTQIAEGLRAFG